jgi:uncharacterized membrane protein
MALLGVLALSGFGAYAVFAAGGKADFSIAASPSSQTVSAGQTTTYGVTITKVNGFAGSVTLSASNLPAGASASWKLADGTASNVVPPNQAGATVTVQTSSATPNGSSQPLITATSGKLTNTTTVTLVVQAAAQPNFTLTASPASQAVVQSDQASYTVTVNRTGGFGGAVSLAVTGLPKGATSSWAPSSTVPGANQNATLQIQTAGNTQTDTYALSINGSGTVGGTSVSRAANVTLIVQKNQNFQISGDLGPKLSPGRRAALDLALTNSQNFAIQVTGIAVGIEEGTSKPGCSGIQNFKVTQIPAARYPITLPAGQTKTMTQLGVADGDKPQIEMLNQPWNQEACKNASLTLVFDGSAGK